MNGLLALVIVLGFACLCVAIVAIADLNDEDDE
jgi:hypothetical protein